MMRSTRRGGVIIRTDAQLYFVPASVAVRISPPPRVTPVPGAPPALLGIALHAGSVVPVMTIGPERAEMVVCLAAGELVGVVGGKVLRTGTFDVVTHRPDLVEYEGEQAVPLDLHGLCASVHPSARTGGRVKAT
jgi:hypothetical protein